MFLIKPYTDETRKALLIFHQVYKLYLRSYDYFNDRKYPFTRNSCINTFVFDEGIRFYFPPSPFSIFLPKDDFWKINGYIELKKEFGIKKGYDFDLLNQPKRFHFKLIKTILTEHVQIGHYLKYP